MKIIFRADGNSAMGLGHVFRSLAVAELLKDDFECVFAIQQPDSGLQQRIKTICKELITLPAAQTREQFLNEMNNYLTGNEIVVLDGYAFETAYQRNVKNKCHRLVCIDDIHAFHFVCDVLINHSGSARREEYSLEENTKYFFGPRYALLRQPFLNFSRNPSDEINIKNLFLNMGGADPFNHTCTVLSQVMDTGFFNAITVVTGSAFTYEPELKKLMETHNNITHHKDISAEKMVIVMKDCGTAICSASSVSFEYATINGLLFLKQIADNQAEVKSYFIENNLAFDFDLDFERILADDTVSIARDSVNYQREIFDKKSGARLKEIFSELI